jgi:hypothetical protein
MTVSRVLGSDPRSSRRLPANPRLIHLIALATAATVCLALPAGAAARLPKPRNAVIVPGASIAGVKLDMSQSQVFSKWGSTQCPSGTCTWQGPGTPGQNERATVSFVHGKAVQITINAAFTGLNQKFKPGTLSKWKTSRGISLGSLKNAVRRAYPQAKPNVSEGVMGFDLSQGRRPNLRYTRFSTPGIGASPNRLRYIELAWDTCHYFKC